MFPLKVYIINKYTKISNGKVNNSNMKKTQTYTFLSAYTVNNYICRGNHRSDIIVFVNL